MATGDSQPGRDCRLLRWNGAVGVIRLRADGKTRLYLVQAIPSDAAGQAFGVLRLTDPTPYHVRASPRHAECSCDCKGFLHYSRCRHVLALRALLQKGKLRPGVAMAERD